MQSWLGGSSLHGLRYSWASSLGPHRKQRKIDRVLINAWWSGEFSFSEASFLAPGISDHTPMVIKIMPIPRSCKPFKFFMFWTTHPTYSNLVSEVWDTNSSDAPTFTLCSKIRLLKYRLKQLNKDSFSDLYVRTSEARQALRVTQEALQLDPFNALLAETENDQMQGFC